MYVCGSLYLMHIYICICMYICYYACTYVLANILGYCIAHLVHSLKATCLSMWETIKSNAKENRENSAELRTLLACPLQCISSKAVNMSFKNFTFSNSFIFKIKHAYLYPHTYMYVF